MNEAETPMTQDELERLLETIESIPEEEPLRRQEIFESLKKEPGVDDGTRTLIERSEREPRFSREWDSFFDELKARLRSAIASQQPVRAGASAGGGAGLGRVGVIGTRSGSSAEGVESEASQSEPMVNR